MKTIEGVELKLGKCKRMPVKRVDKFNLDLDHLEKHIHKELKNAMQSKPIIGRIDGGNEEAPLGPDGKPRILMPKNPYLMTMEEKYYQNILSKIKPANYHD